MHQKAIRTADRFLVFGAPAIEEAEIQEVVASMRSGWLGTGPKVARFEEDFRSYRGAEHAVAVSSCTAALHLSLLAAGLQPGDEVITTPLTFCATVNAILHAGATPVLADVDPETMNIDPSAVEEKITPRTRAVLPVHFAGRSCDMDRLCALTARGDLLLIEDCAHAIETEYKGRKAGSFGSFGCFSFYVTKNVTTGEGGMVLTRSEEDAARIKRLALHGLSKDAWKRFSDEGYKHYYVAEVGFKYNMMDIQAAIGIHQLQRVEPYWHRRREIWQHYDQAFAGLPLKCPAPPAADTRHAYHLYTLLIDEQRAGIARDAFLEAMCRRNIGVGVHYLGIPEHPYYRDAFGWKPEQYPHATRIGRQTVSLPLSARLTDEDVEDVIAAVQDCLEHPAG
jgi:dTDP-4-amino-4,6-dideoxygalactose transaminase